MLREAAVTPNTKRTQRLRGVCDAPAARARFAGAFHQLTVNRVFHGSIASLIPTL